MNEERSSTMRPERVFSTVGRRELTAIWSNRYPLLSKSGFRSVPASLLGHYAAMGISSAELVFLLHLLSSMRTGLKSRQPFRILAEKMGVTDICVRKYARDLEKRGFLLRDVQPGNANIFDLAPLFDCLEDEVMMNQIVSSYSDQAEATEESSGANLFTPFIIDKGAKIA